MTPYLLALLLQIVPIRFAWISDLHVGSQGAADALERAVGQLNRQDGIRFVILTGDITEMGSDEELHTARRVLAGLRHPFHIIPGNHDTKWSESGTTTFSRLFGSNRFAFTLGSYTFVGISQGPLLRMADGHFAPDELRWCDSTLARARRVGSPVIFISHYPIDSGIVNWYELLDRLDSTDVRLFLVGHGHRNMILSFEGYPGLMGTALIDGAGRGPAYNIVTITGDSVWVREEGIPAAQSPPWSALQLSRVRPERSTASRPDFSVNAIYPEVRVAWKWNGGFTITSAAASGNGVVVTGDASGTVHALRTLDGTHLWAHRTNGPIFAAPAIAGDRVVVTSADSTVRCLDLHTGDLRWKYLEGAPTVAAPAVSGDKVFVGGSDGKFRSLDLDSGKEIWSFDSVSGFVETRALVHQGRVYFGSWGERFYALDAATGRLVWHWQSPRRGRLFSPAACLPVARGRLIFLVAPDRAMTVLDRETGNIVWRSVKHQVRESLGMTSDSTLVIVRTMRDSLIAFASDADQPVEKWISTPGFGYDINAAMPVEKDGRVFYGSMKGFVYSLNAADGRVQWIHRASPVTINTLVPLNGHEILATDFDGNVMLLRDAHE
jgi:outer membrane protein assembly factor BamB/predicted MPP superfamily phosphohydrolase